jgi:hypothetical protein
VHSLRIVTVGDIEIAIHTALDNPGGYYRRAAPAGRSCRAAVKVAVGMCNPNCIVRAEQLRLDYQNHRRTRISDDPTARADRDRLRRPLLRISDGATDAIGPRTGTCGPALRAELQVVTPRLGVRRRSSG